MYFTNSRPQTGDILIAEDHPVNGAFPWTQQSMGCGRPGEFVYLPYSFIAPSNSSQIGKMISNQWMRLRYGIFDDLDPRHNGLSVTSVHHGQCHGRGVRKVIKSHKDFMKARLPTNFTIPRFQVARQSIPKYVIVLENSQAMNMKDHWDFIRTACKKFIKFDLPNKAHVGLVLFNEAAHIAKPISMLGPTTDPESRDGLAFSIKNKYNLSPSSGSCIRCGIEKAVEALTTSGSTHGGVLIVISRGGVTSISRDDEKEVKEKVDKHNLQMFSISIPLPPVTDISLSLERLAHATGGESFFIVDNSVGDHSTLDTYVGLTDTFREIQERTVGSAPSLVRDFSIYQRLSTSEKGNILEIEFPIGIPISQSAIFRSTRNILSLMRKESHRRVATSS